MNESHAQHDKLHIFLTLISETLQQYFFLVNSTNPELRVSDECHTTFKDLLACRILTAGVLQNANFRSF